MIGQKFSYHSVSKLSFITLFLLNIKYGLITVILQCIHTQHKLIFVIIFLFFYNLYKFLVAIVMTVNFQTIRMYNLKYKISLVWVLLSLQVNSFQNKVMGEKFNSSVDNWTSFNRNKQEQIIFNLSIKRCGWNRLYYYLQSYSYKSKKNHN